MVHYERSVQDSVGLSDSASVAVTPEVIPTTTRIPTPKTTTTLDVLDLPAPPGLDDRTLDIVALDDRYRLYTLRNGLSEALDQGIGDDDMDAFVDLTMRLEDGPDPDFPNS